jgi:hypothetical protein
MLLQHEDHITGKLSFKPEEEIGGTSGLIGPSLKPDRYLIDDSPPLSGLQIQ